MKNWIAFVSVCCVLLLFNGCAGVEDKSPSEMNGKKILHSVKRIPLEGPAASADAEISGLAWCGDQLVLLPQYPDFDGKSPRVFSIPREKLKRFIENEFSTAIVPDEVMLTGIDLQEAVKGFEGLEAVAFSGKDAFFTIEARVDGIMHGYLLKGRSDFETHRIVLDPQSLRKLEMPIQLSNMSYESLLILRDRIVAMYEANGINVNPDPRAEVYDTNLNNNGFTAFPSLEYRVTDACAPDDSGSFWVVNYFWPGEQELLNPGPDAFSEFDNEQGQHVERLVELRYSHERIELGDNRPLFLELTNSPRNWEGLARMGQGFILVTDKHPETILAYVK